MMTLSQIQDRGPQINAVNYAFLVITTVAVLLRFWGRMVALKASFWWDDWLSLTALVSILPVPSESLLNFSM